MELHYELVVLVAEFALRHRRKWIAAEVTGKRLRLMYSKNNASRMGRSHWHLEQVELRLQLMAHRHMGIDEIVI